MSDSKCYFYHGLLSQFDLYLCNVLLGQIKASVLEYVLAEQVTSPS